MRISFDTQQDTYEDALAVLRRAYGQRGPVRQQGEDTSRRRDQPGVGPDAVAAGARGAKKTASSAAKRVPREARASAGERATRPRREAPSTSRRGTRPAKQPEAAKTSATDRGQKAAASKIARRKPASKREPSDSPNEGRGRKARKATAAGSPANVAPPGQSEEVRAWARERGMDVSDRGRLPAQVIAAYQEAHKD